MRSPARIDYSSHFLKSSATVSDTIRVNLREKNIYELFYNYALDRLRKICDMILAIWNF